MPLKDEDRIFPVFVVVFLYKQLTDHQLRLFIAHLRRDKIMIEGTARIGMKRRVTFCVKICQEAVGIWGLFSNPLKIYGYCC